MNLFQVHRNFIIYIKFGVREQRTRCFGKTINQLNLLYCLTKIFASFRATLRAATIQIICEKQLKGRDNRKFTQSGETFVSKKKSENLCSQQAQTAQSKSTLKTNHFEEQWNLISYKYFWFRESRKWFSKRAID